MTKPVYKWTLDADFVFYTPFDFGVERQYHDEKGRVWLTVSGARCTIHKGYSWDGCSPKFSLGGKLFGVWDGKVIDHSNKIYTNVIQANLDTDQALKYASLIHDVLCQFSDMFPLEVTQKKIDKLFYKYCKMVEFRLSWIYYQAVRLYQRNKE